MKEDKKDTMMTINAHISKSMYGNASLDHVFKIVSEETGISGEEMEGNNRKREIVFARQLYCYYSIALVKGDRPVPSLATIGSMIGKDHATVLHSRKTIEDLMTTNKAIRNRVIDTQHKIELKLNKLPNGLVLKVKDPLKAYIHEKIDYALSEIPLFNMEEEFVLMSGEKKNVNTALTIIIPNEYRGEIHTEHGIFIIYEGETKILVPVENKSNFPVMINNKELIGKIIISKTERVVLIDIDLE